LILILKVAVANGSAHPDYEPFVEFVYGSARAPARLSVRTRVTVQWF